MGYPVGYAALYSHVASSLWRLWHDGDRGSKTTFVYHQQLFTEFRWFFDLSVFTLSKMRQNVVPLSVGWIVVSFIVYKITQIFLTNRKYAAQAKDFGCQEPPAWRGGPILDLQHLKDMQKADTDQLFPNFLIHREEVMSKTLGRHCTTFSFNTLGQTSIFTSDPENIKTVLATKFPDFDLGPARRGNMIRTLGDGIVGLGSTSRVLLI